MFNHFHDRLVLHSPVLLPPASPGDRRVLLWFSQVDFEGRDTVVCIVRTDVGAATDVYANGTEATVSGPCSIVGRMLVVVASDITSSGASVVPVASLPPFAGSVWPALICAGVVSAPQLAVNQPGLVVTEVVVKRQDSWLNAPVEIKCNAVARLGVADGTKVVLCGRLMAFDNNHFRIAVHDVALGSEIVWWEQPTVTVAGNLTEASAEVAFARWPIPYIPQVCVNVRTVRGKRSYEITSQSRPGPFF